MAAQIIDGEAVAARIRERLTQEVAELVAEGHGPHLVAIEANDNPGSKMYVRCQQESCEEVGIRYTVDEHPVDSTQQRLAARIRELNADAGVTSMILQMPLPKGCDSRVLQAAMVPSKDAEGISQANLGRLVLTCSQAALKRRGTPKDYDAWVRQSLEWRLPVPAPCTAVGAMTLIRGTGVDLYGKHAVVVGHSEIVGKPLVLLLLAHFCTVTCCHIATPDLAEHTRKADVLVVATGKAGAAWAGYRRRLRRWKKAPEKHAKPSVPDLSPLVKGDMVRPGAVVIDVATNRIPRAIDDDGQAVKGEDGKTDLITVGDVDFESASQVASHITPVPGGVGPMTTALLLRNVVEALKAD